MATEPITPPIPSQIDSTPAHPGTMSSQLSTMDPSSPLPAPILTTARLIIRPMHPQDASSMQQACAPASITKYMSLAFAHPYTLQHAETWISTNLTENLPNYVLTLHDSPTVVMGGVGLKPGSDVQSHTAEVGYWIAEEYWGMGYMTEALRAFTDYVFSEKGDVWRRLWAGVFSGNEASMGTLKKCGYAEEGVMKGHVEKHGEVRDLHMFGLTRKDWEATKQSRT